jgi:ATP/maltotriose-dependent transcriptional regulator MalT
MHELLERHLDHPDPWARAMLRLMSGALAENYGDLETMEQQFPLALKEFRALGDRWGIGTAVGAMANIYSARGEVAEAIAALQEARELMAQMRAWDDETFALMRIGMMRLRLGDLPGARTDVAAALDNAVRIGSAAAKAHATFGLAVLAHHEGWLGEAKRLGDEAQALIDRSPMPAPQLRAGILCGLSAIAVSSGAPDEATRYLVEAYAAAMSARDMPVAATVAACLANVMLAQGQPAVAAQLLGAGVRLRGMEDLSDPTVLRVAEAARVKLGPQEYITEYTSGRQLTRQAALALIETNL